MLYESIALPLSYISVQLYNHNIASMPLGKICALYAYGQPTVEIGQKLTIPDSAARTTADADLDTEDEQEKQVAGIQEVNEMPSTAIETHTVAPGESLWSIAEQYYGEGGQWFIIAEDEHNDVGLLENGRPLVHVGDVLVVPSIN